MPEQHGTTFTDPEPEPKDPIVRKDLGDGKDPKEPQKEGDKPAAPSYDGELEKYQGKTADELVGMLEDQHTYIGKVTAERDKVKGDLEFGERIQHFTKPEPEPVIGDEPKPDDEGTDADYVSRGDLKSTINEAIKADRVVRQGETQQKLTTMATYAHEEGKAELEANPELYKGIEKETEMGVYQTLKPYLDAGYDVSGYLKDSKTWERVGRQIRFNRGEYDLLQRVDGKKRPASTQTVEPVEGEIPSAGRQDVTTSEKKGNVKLDAKGRYIADYFGLTEEEAIEGVKGVRKGRAE